MRKILSVVMAAAYLSTVAVGAAATPDDPNGEMVIDDDLAAQKHAEGLGISVAQARAVIEGQNAQVESLARFNRENPGVVVDARFEFGTADLTVFVKDKAAAQANAGLFSGHVEFSTEPPKAEPLPPGRYVDDSHPNPCKNDDTAEGGRFLVVQEQYGPFGSGWCTTEHEAALCTSGFAVARGSVHGVLTAGHCALSGTLKDNASVGWADNNGAAGESIFYWEGFQALSVLNLGNNSSSYTSYQNENDGDWAVYMERYETTAVRGRVYLYSQIWEKVTQQAWGDEHYVANYLICGKFASTAWDEGHQEAYRCGWIHDGSDGGGGEAGLDTHFFSYKLYGNKCTVAGDSGSAIWADRSDGDIKALGIHAGRLGSYPLCLHYATRIDKIVGPANVALLKWQDGVG